MHEEKNIIHCSFTNETSLYLAYMPFINEGGIFVRTIKEFTLGQKVELSILLMEESDPHLIQGKVIWITPKGAQANKPAGIGVQFENDKNKELAHKIESYLAGMLKSNQITDSI